LLLLTILDFVHPFAILCIFVAILILADRWMIVAICILELELINLIVVLHVRLMDYEQA
jgi:hypothetical protein